MWKLVGKGHYDDNKEYYYRTERNTKTGEHRTRKRFVGDNRQYRRGQVII